MSDSRWQRMTEAARWWFGFFAVVWLTAMSALLAIYWFGRDSQIPWIVLAYAAVTVLASLVAFALYGIDKRRAARDRQRISERVLHAASLIGGWPGAYLAQRLFRHKTQKRAFRMAFWTIVLLHAAVLAYCAVAWFQGPASVST